MNTIKTIRSSALDYGSNTTVKDYIKTLSATGGSDWCRTVYISDLIKSGYLKSDNYYDQITDLYSGEPIGYNSLTNPFSSDSNDKTYMSTVSICYCKDTLDIDAFVTKDLGMNRTYVAGEYIRVLNGSDKYSFKYVSRDFFFFFVLSGVIKALKNSSYTYTYDGLTLNLSEDFMGVTNFSKDDATFMSKFNKLIADKFTSFEKCNH